MTSIWSETPNKDIGEPDLNAASMSYTPLFFLPDEEELKANAPRDNAQMNPTLFVEEEDEIFPRLVFDNGVAVFSSSNKERRSPLFSSLFNRPIVPMVFMMIYTAYSVRSSLSRKAIDLSVKWEPRVVSQEKVLTTENDAREEKKEYKLLFTKKCEKNAENFPLPLF